MSDYSKAKEEYDSIVAKDEKIDILESQVKDLSLIIRRMHRYATSNSPLIACGKIQTLFDKSKHLLSKISPKKKTHEHI